MLLGYHIAILLCYHISILPYKYVTTILPNNYVTILLCDYVTMLYHVTMCWIRRSALSWKSVYDGRGGAGIKFNVVHWDGLAGTVLYRQIISSQQIHSLFDIFQGNCFHLKVQLRRFKYIIQIRVPGVRYNGC